MKSRSYVDLLLAEWGIQKRSRVRTCMRRVLSELTPGVQLELRQNQKLQVAVVPEAAFSAWAYFPIHRKRWIVRHLDLELKPTARVLLVISEKRIEEQSPTLTDADLRDHLGHTLLYLRSPRKRNECADAFEEWRRSVNEKPSRPRC
jgi:hypothetical protein